jgi:hypothetical protein
MTDKMIIDNWVDNTPPTEEDVYARLYFGSPATLKLTPDHNYLQPNRLEGTSQLPLSRTELVTVSRRHYGSSSSSGTTFKMPLKR